MDCEASVLQFSESSLIRDIVVDIDKPLFSFFVCCWLKYYVEHTDRLFVVKTYFIFLSHFPISKLGPKAGRSSSPSQPSHPLSNLC